MKRNRSLIIVLLLLVILIFLQGQSSAVAQEGVLDEPFNQPDLAGWELSPGSRVEDGALILEPNGYAIYGASWTEAYYIIRLQWTGEGGAVIRYQNSDTGAYVLRINAEEIRLLADRSGELDELGFAAATWSSGDWLALSIAASGSAHRVLLNDSPILEVDVPAALPPGGLLLAPEGEAAVHIDHVFVEAAGAPGIAPDGEPAREAFLADSASLAWVRTGGPPGGLGYDIRYNYDNPDIWYVTDANAGVFISTDNGYTWNSANEGIPPHGGPSGDSVPIFSLTVDPLNPQIVWAGTSETGHIYRSTDGGWTWEGRDAGITIEYDFLTFRGFTIDPRSSDIVYAMAETNIDALGGTSVWGGGTGGAIYKTLDGGLSWTKIWDGGVPSSLARYLWVHPENPDILYTSTGIFDRGAVGEGNYDTDPLGGLGILVSNDGGETWTVQGEENGLRMLYIGSLYMHPEDPDVLLAAAGHVQTYIGTYLDLLRSQNVPSPSGVYRTEDGGEHWSQVLTPPSDRMLEAFSAVEICPSDPSIAYAASEMRVYRSEDSGKTWEELPSGVLGWGPQDIKTGFPIDIQCDSRDPSRLFINNYAGGNFLSEDGGRTWANASNGYTGAVLHTVAVSPSAAGLVYAGGPSGIWRSRDGGAHWEGIANSTAEVVLDLTFNAVAVDPSNSQHLLLGGSADVFASDDSGATWYKPPIYSEQGEHLEGEGLAGLQPISHFAFAPPDPLTIYAGFADGACIIYHESCPDLAGEVLVSTDGGASWTLHRDALPDNSGVFRLAVDPSDASRVFAATETGLHVAVDGGLTWQSVGGDLAGRRVSAVAIDPENAQHILAGVDQAGVWKSVDGGASWEQQPAGMEPNAVIHDIVFDPTSSSNVVASDIASGVYVSTDGGRSWTRITQGLSNRSANSLAFTSDGQHIYAGTQGGGVFRLDVNGQPPVASEIPSTVSEVEGTAPQEGEEPQGDSGDEIIEPASQPAERTAPNLSLFVGIGAAALVVLAGGLLLVRRRRKAEQ